MAIWIDAAGIQPKPSKLNNQVSQDKKKRNYPYRFAGLAAAAILP